MIAGAEAHRIRRALESVAGWTRELIVVVNEEVRDGTEEIALRHGARVFREPWKGFIGQKNSAQAKASQPWVLGLDADEEVSAGLRDEILALFGSGPDPFAAYSMPRCSYYFGRWIRHGDWYPDRCIRLWPQGRGAWTGIDPHAMPRVEGAVRVLRGDLLHYSMETFEHQIAKTMAYADDFVRHCAERGDRVTYADLVLRPAWRFVRGFVFRLGFLDGWQGYSIAWMTAFYTFLRYAKARAERPGEKLRS
jgi:glycosyltransferase involved in cell wall biosynthesis